MTNQRRGRENSKSKIGPTSKEMLAKLSKQIGIFFSKLLIHMVWRSFWLWDSKIGGGVTGPSVCSVSNDLWYLFVWNFFYTTMMHCQLKFIGHFSWSVEISRKRISWRRRCIRIMVFKFKRNGKQIKYFWAYRASSCKSE